MAAINDANLDETPSRRVDEALSRKLAKRVQATENQCYWNSLKVLALADRTLARYDPLLPTASYVEGWLILGKVPLAHGWLELADGRLIDVTLPTASEGYRDRPAKRWERAEAVRQYQALHAARLDTRIEAFPLWSGGNEWTPAFQREYLPALLALWEAVGITIPDEMRRDVEEAVTRVNDATAM